MLRSLLLFAALSLSALTNTVAQQTDCPPRGYMVGVFNGVWTDYVQAWANVEAVQNNLGIHFHEQPITYTRFYNPSVSKFDDLLEVFKQLEEVHPELRGKFELLWGTVEFAEMSGGTSGNSAVLMQEMLREREIAAALRTMNTHQPIVDGFHLRVRGYTSENSRLKFLGVAHSQGNLFLNAVYRQMKQMDSAIMNMGVFNTVHVASPDAVVTESALTQNSGDEVINAVRTAFGTAPDWNVNGSGHEFIRDYLRPGSEALLSIRGHLYEQMLYLREYPCPTNPPVGSETSCRVQPDGAVQVTVVGPADSDWRIISTMPAGPDPLVWTNVGAGDYYWGLTISPPNPCQYYGVFLNPVCVTPTGSVAAQRSPIKWRCPAPSTSFRAGGTFSEQCKGYAIAYGVKVYIGYLGDNDLTSRPAEGLSLSCTQEPTTSPPPRLP